MLIEFCISINHFTSYKWALFIELAQWDSHGHFRALNHLFIFIRISALLLGCIFSFHFSCVLKYSAKSFSHFLLSQHVITPLYLTFDLVYMTVNVTGTTCVPLCKRKEQRLQSWFNGLKTVWKNHWNQCNITLFGDLPSPRGDLTDANPQFPWPFLCPTLQW